MGETSISAIREELEQALSKSRLSKKNEDYNCCFRMILSRIEQALAEKIDQRQTLALAVLKAVRQCGSSHRQTRARLETLNEYARNQMDQSKMLSIEIRQYESVFKEMARRGDEALGSSIQVMLQQRLYSSPWSQQALSPIVVILSDVFGGLRTALEESPTTVSKPWVAPDSFERSTSKYWVEDSRLPVLLLTCVGEAPLLVYGKQGHLSTEINLRGDNNVDCLWDNFASTISSVYFDSADLTLYRERLARREGAQLLRARWYGKLPASREPVFLELKTHHESWVNVKSVKERATVLEEDMSSFLYSEHKWKHGHARQVLLKASPTLSGEKLSKSIDLLLRMRDLVVKNKLRPCMRSTYKRLAFQSSQSNSLRLTLDRRVVVSDEKSAKHGQWCAGDDAMTECGSSRIVPFSVFEIKLGEGQQSSALDQLIDEGVLIDAAKFSKFLTGAATFNMNQLPALPYWAEHKAFSAFFVANQANIGDGIANISAIFEKSNTTLDKFESFSSSSTNQTSNSSPAVSDDSEDLCKDVSKQGSRMSMFSSNTKKSDSKWIAPKKAVRIEPKTYFANERTFIQWVSAALFLVTTSALLLEFDQGQGYIKATSKVLLLFALVISIYALYLYYHRIVLIRQGRPYGYISHFGPICLTGAAIIGTVILLNQVLKGGLAVSLLDVAPIPSTPIYVQNNQCLQHSLGDLSPLEFEPSDIWVDSERNIFLVPSLTEIASFPAPVWTTEGLQVPSARSPAIVATLQNADLEALTYNGGTLYALSEPIGSENSSRMIALEWAADIDVLFPTGEWNIGSSLQSEGIALVKDPRKDHIELYISGENGNGDATVRIFGVPDPNGIVSDPSQVPVLTSNRAINEKLLGADLVDPKIAAMTFFEGILYILHDNELLVRAWDISTGKLTAEWGLPEVATGSSKQWEGLAFQRIQKPAASLRGSDSASVLLLHLAHDTPAAIWTLVVEEGETPGSIILPECSGVYSPK